jgi:Xaa-Pro dipeptidase
MEQFDLSYINRQERLAHELEQASLDCLALNTSPSLAYLTGLHFHLSERPVVAFFTPGQPVVLALPELEIAKINHLPYPLRAFPYTEDPATWAGVFHAAVQEAGIDIHTIGVEPNRLRFLELKLLEKAVPTARFVSAEAILATLRMVKDAHEIMAMRKAVDIAQRALIATIPSIKIGVTERELASELTLQLIMHGSDVELHFTPIVSAGPNSANPHATPTDRPLQHGDLLVIDWGAIHRGYVSDLTRTFAIGKIDVECLQIAQVVQEANAAARAAARPGIPAELIDLAARSVIDAAGFGEYFTHRTGHGLGMEGHEPPYIRHGNLLILEPGMTFTIEPGVYLPDRNGVRIEDNMLITPLGGESLSDLPRDLHQIGRWN